MRTDPIATVLDSCVGCGVCGANAHAAVLCPSFYRSDVVHNPTPRDKLRARVRALWMKVASADLEAHAARFEGA
jgi:indolepyruvate ferredoxin oxidoreductase alpha subunit